MYTIRRQMMRNRRETFNIAKITIRREKTQLAYTIGREDQRIAHGKTKTKTTGKNIQEK